MEKAQSLKHSAKTYRPRFAVLFLAFIVLLMVNIAFSSCSDDTESQYIGYGTVEKTSESNYQIKMDDGYTLNPQESCIPASFLRDSMRLIVNFTMLDQLDSTYNVRINGADTILTKPILPYDESKSDSIGNDPVKIGDVWIASGFINFDFLYSGGYPYPSERHMVNLLHHSIADGILPLEFRHNAFNDQRETVYRGIVSFPLDKLTKDMEKPVKLQIKYQESANTTKTIDITYR